MHFSKEKGYKFLGALLLLLLASSAHAASMRVRMPQETIPVGSIITAPLFLETDEAANAISATILFPSFLEPLSVSYDDTPISFWIVRPTLNRQANTLTAEGVVLGEGFVGSGDLLNIQMRVKSVGEGYVTLQKGSVLAHDGQGTNLLTNLEASNRFVATVHQDGIEIPVAEAIDGLELRAPKITRYASRIRDISEFFVEGTTYSNAEVNVSIRRLNNVTENFETQSDAEGNFRFVYPVNHISPEESVAQSPGKRMLAAVLTIQGLEYEFWVWAEKDGITTPKTDTIGVASEGFSWAKLSFAIDPSTLLIIIAALTGFLITTAFGLFIVRLLNKKSNSNP